MSFTRAFKSIKPRIKRAAVLSIVSLILLVLLCFQYNINKRSNTQPQESITRKDKKLGILLFVGIFSAPIRNDRRNAIRETWMQKCKMNVNVVCWFFTDGQDSKGMTLEGESRTNLENENRHYKDLVFVESPAGLNFGRRILWMLEWATKRYDFQYALRLDFQYALRFICFDKLVNELQHHRPKKLFTWGWLHCNIKGKVRLDEAFLVFTRDVVQSFLDRKNSSLLCHAWGGLSVEIWSKAISGLTTFSDMKRLIVHFEPKEKIITRDEICQTRIGIHHSYPEQMRLYWNISLSEKRTLKVEIPPVTFDCHLPRGIEEKRWNQLDPQIGPRLCKDNPIWDSGEYYEGHEKEIKQRT